MRFTYQPTRKQMPVNFDANRSIEDLDGERWGDPPSESTGLVQTMHALRKRPLASLTAYELGRLIGQNVGLRWTLPLALEVLRDTVDINNRGGFYDDDLLTATLGRKAETWVEFPELANELKDIVTLLEDLPTHATREARRFLKTFEGWD
ncbi:contact-dependent growth inhibition system immunity protein [Streptomyces sp. NPDC002033]|uniref:contact-dependent growth inhibition system immunity protein n=1 Tax=unclassified Streptomyces TaxID=2593676 RepID=UPI00331BA813